MVNIEDFVKRLEKILEYYNLNASAFADKIGVQRSSLSHLLSARNKPSLDFVLKIIEVFPEVDLYWILNGKGIFPKIGSNLTTLESTKVPLQPNLQPKEDLFSIPEPKGLPLDEKQTKEHGELSNLVLDHSIKIEKIVVFYENGTFKAYKPQ